MCLLHPATNDYFQCWLICSDDISENSENHPGFWKLNMTSSSVLKCRFLYLFNHWLETLTINYGSLWFIMCYVLDFLSVRKLFLTIDMIYVRVHTRDMACWHCLPVCCVELAISWNIRHHLQLITVQKKKKTFPRRLIFAIQHQRP